MSVEVPYPGRILKKIGIKKNDQVKGKIMPEIYEFKKKLPTLISKVYRRGSRYPFNMLKPIIMPQWEICTMNNSSPFQDSSTPEKSLEKNCPGEALEKNCFLENFPKQGGGGTVNPEKFGNLFETKK